MEELYSTGEASGETTDAVAPAARSVSASRRKRKERCVPRSGLGHEDPLVVRRAIHRRL
jgi:hypothetical protein